MGIKFFTYTSIFMILFIRGGHEHAAIQSIAQQLGHCPIQIRGSELTLPLPAAYGQGELQVVKLGSCINLLLFRGSIREDWELHYLPQPSHPLRILYGQKAALNYRFAPQRTVHTLSPLHALLCASSPTYQYVCKLPKSQPIQFLSLEIQRTPYFSERTEELQTLPLTLRRILLEKESAIDPFHYQQAYCLQLADINYQIQTTSLLGFSRWLFLKARVLELLAQMLIHYNNTNNPYLKQVSLYKPDIALIKKAHQMLMDHLSENVTIPTLAREVGVNPTKLKKGFKQLYGYTINDYRRKKRLAWAETLLLTTNFTAKEVTLQVGYRNYAYFVACFKDHYGISPLEYTKLYGTKAIVSTNPSDQVAHESIHV